MPEIVPTSDSTRALPSCSRIAYRPADRLNRRRASNSRPRDSYLFLSFFPLPLCFPFSTFYAYHLRFQTILALPRALVVSGYSTTGRFFSLFLRSFLLLFFHLFLVLLHLPFFIITHGSDILQRREPNRINSTSPSGGFLSMVRDWARFPRATWLTHDRQTRACSV